MMISLAAKNKLGFVDGTIKPPAEIDPEYPAWFRANSMVIGWLINSLHKNIGESVLFFQTAQEIWTELKNRYEQSDGDLLYQIQQQLYSLSQGADDFSSYFTKLTKIWDELRIVQGIPACSCASGTTVNKVFEEQRLIQLLVGLNDSYKILRGQILMMKPLPSISTVHSMIIQEERQRGITNSSSFSTDAIAMHASSESGPNQYKKPLICNNCKKPGHTKAQCYRLIGFPPNFNFTKSKANNSKPSVQQATTVASSPITAEQYDQLLSLLKNNNISTVPNQIK